MFEKLELTRMAQALAAHAGTRMGVIAENVANSERAPSKAEGPKRPTATPFPWKRKW